jgi:MFS family permease
MALVAYIPRMSGIMLMVIAAIFTQGSAVLFISIAAFIAVDSGFSLWNTTTTASLLKIIPRGKEGSVLGTNSSIVGAGLLIGSVFAGEMATVFGYDITFTIGMSFLFASFAMMKKFYKRVQVPILVPELRQLKTKTR